MLKIHTLTMGLYQTNTYIVHDEEHWLCCVIDPGYNAEGIAKYVEDHHLRIDAILLTHGHFDHVGAAKKLADMVSCEVYMCQRDLLLPEHLTAGSLDYTEELEDCQHIWSVSYTHLTLPTILLV